MFVKGDVQLSKYSQPTHRTTRELHDERHSKMHYHQVETHRTRVIERSKRYAIIGLAIGIVCGFLLCLWSKPLILCTIDKCCLKQQLREKIRHEIVEEQRAPQQVLQKKRVITNYNVLVILVI